MKIVFLDAATVDLGDVATHQIKKLGSYRAYSNTTSLEVFSRSKNAAVVIANKVEFNGALLSHLPHLKLLCVAATGVNNVDLEVAKNRGIAVTNVSGYSTQTVAEHAVMFLLAFSHRLMPHHKASLEGRWSASPHFVLLDYPFSDLREKILGIIGYGKIGRKVAQMARALGMKVLVAGIPGRIYQGSRTPLQTLLRKSDFVSLHCPLSKKTFHLINQERLNLMKPTSYLLNLARGPVVDLSAVVWALKKKKLAGFATDVLDEEPPPKNHPLFQKSLCDRVLVTPHMAWASRESRQRLINEIAENIRSFKRGGRRNRVV